MKKIKIITNLSEKALLRVLVAVSCMLFILIALMCVHTYKCKDYVVVQAEVIDSYQEWDDDDSQATYLTVTFEYGGVVYTADKRVSFANNQLGSLIEIKCNPQNPAEIENTFAFRTMIVISAFVGLFCVFLIVAICQERNKRKRLKT